MTSQEYADNLIGYLDAARTTKTLTIGDLSNVLHALHHMHENVPENTVLDEDSNSPVNGEHNIAFWIEPDNSIQWYLGAVDDINSDFLLVYSSTN